MLLQKNLKWELCRKSHARRQYNHILHACAKSECNIVENSTCKNAIIMYCMKVVNCLLAKWCVWQWRKHLGTDIWMDTFLPIGILNITYTCMMWVSLWVSEWKLFVTTLEYYNRQIIVFLTIMLSAWQTGLILINCVRQAVCTFDYFLVNTLESWVLL